MVTAFSRYAAVLVLSACVMPSAATEPPPAPAQRQLPRNEHLLPGLGIVDAPGGMQPGTDPFMLLENDLQVQKELALDEGQVRRLADTGQLFRTQMAELVHADDDTSKAEMERQKWLSRGAIAHILTPKQLGRLREIMLQLGGPCMAVSEQALAQDLRLSDEQLQGLRSACQQSLLESWKALETAPDGGGSCAAAAANRATIALARDSGRKRVMELLSKSQQQTLETLKGPPFAWTPTPSDACVP